MRTRRVLAVMLGSAFFSLAGCPRESDVPVTTSVKLERVASGIAAPVGIVFPDDGTGRAFILSQPGRIFVMTRDGAVSETPLLDLRDHVIELTPTYDERGLLGMALHPQFGSNGRFFVFYNAVASDAVAAASDSEVRVSEFAVSSADENIADPASERILLRVGKPQFNHNGGQLAFGADGFLYISIGDGGGANDEGDGHNAAIGNGQDLTTLLGKILRIDVDGGEPYAIPDDNPFVGDATVRPEIFAYGLRNPWRFSFDSETGRLIAGDVGQDEFEEVNIIESGGNYGWRIWEANNCFSPESVNATTCPETGLRGEPLIKPILEYSHDEGVSVVGGFVYRGSAIAGLKEAYVFADWSQGFIAPNGRLFAAREDDAGEWTFEELRVSGGTNDRIGRFIYALGHDARGELFVLTNDALSPTSSGGEVWRIVADE
ncbi:MAG: PQQ-dependent sugar dehydrogenase [Phycisphaerae bacterium]